MAGCRITALFFVLVLIALLPGCNIKEGRDRCPCYLLLDMTDVTMDVFVDVSAAEALHLSDSVAAEVDEYEMRVPRQGVLLNVLKGDDGFFREGTGVSIPKGYDCPPVYMHSAWVPTAGEVAHEKVQMHKVFCGIAVITNEFPANCALEIAGGIAGYSLNGDMAPGEFQYRFYPGREGRSYVRVPRQRDHSLMLCILDGSQRRSFALGEYIAETGYDWSAPDLADIEVEIDYASTEVTFRMDTWEKTVRLEVLI